MKHFFVTWLHLLIGFGGAGVVIVMAVFIITKYSGFMDEE
jgi:hypothetical protein